ncbi:ATPase H(+)-transporting accessory protein 2 [Periplaneta americana]|uniref:ATPase H(+)-transporting accessory protein 2 n=1 Tax=Periplaneta americana TaxID=6978 RepID=UPI0037E8E091
MLKIIIFLTAVIVTVYGAGELTILHSSGSPKFTGREQVDESLLKEIFAACLGFTIKKGSDWSGLSVSHPFNFPEAVVVVMVDGIASLDLKEGHSYPLNTDEDEFYTYQALHNNVDIRYPGQNATLLRMDLTEEADTDKPYSHFFGDYEDTPTNWTVKYLNPSVAEDKQFLDEMAVLRTIAKLVDSGLVSCDGVPDVYWIVVRSLHAVMDLHGRDSEAAKEANKILQNVIHAQKKAFIQAYKGRVIVAAVCSDVSHTRRTRSLMAEADGQPDLNLAPEYSPDYPVIFNIILWFGIAFVFSLLAISLFIADMDPGRDSIIYRMTSTRMKKDN